MLSNIKSQPDATLVNTSDRYKVFRIDKTEPTEIRYFDARENDEAAKRAGADVLSRIEYFYF